MTGVLPTGTVTFLFTDVEGSTRLWELHPEAMKPVLVRHDAALQEAIEANRGLIVKTTGDGCHAVFETALNALLAALAAQHALQADPWTEILPQVLRSRMGVHSGEAEVRAGDYYGPALNRAARLMSAGHGGQVLVSATTAELVRDLVPTGTALIDLGEHRLKDLIRPEHVFQLAHPDLQADFPPLHSLDAYPNNLPIQATSFVGREREIAEASRMLSAARLLTLTGSGGTGKTRLALQLAADVLPSFPDGVWLAELAPLASPDLVLQTVAAAYGLREIPGIPLLDLVTDYMRSKRLLLVLDNCEHLIEACAQLADHFLRTCPDVKLIASSREALGIAGEVSYRVPSLSLPDLADPTQASLAKCEAVQLFLERAAAVNPRFALTESNAPAIAQICRRLDGIPLALELAAARTRAFSGEQIASRLDDRFRLLTGGSRTALPRQQTLRALIDWSYDLLSEPERVLLLHLSVFVGGWTLEAAEAVCPDLDVLDLLAQLVNKSLVIADEQGGQVRYRLLETVRQYARDRLFESGEMTAVRDRHLDYFLRLAEEAEPGLRGGAAFDWIERLEPDDDNFRAATEWGQERRPEDALLLSGRYMFYAAFRLNDRAKAINFLRGLLARVDAPPGDDPASRRRRQARAGGLAQMCLYFMGQGDMAAGLAAFTEAVALERQLDDKLQLAFTLGMWATLTVLVGDAANYAAAHAAAEESVTLIRETGNKRWLMVTLPALVVLEIRLGNHARAQALREEMRLLVEQADHPLFMTALLGLGAIARFQGQFDDARAYFHKSLNIARRLKTSQFEVVSQSELVHLARLEGKLDEARDGYRQLIVKWKELGQRAAVAHQLECLAFVAHAEREPERAVRLLGAAEALRDLIQVSMTNDERQEYDREVAALRDQLAAHVFASAWVEGRAMSMDRAVAYAITPTSETATSGGN